MYIVAYKQRPLYISYFWYSPVENALSGGFGDRGVECKITRTLITSKQFLLGYYFVVMKFKPTNVHWLNFEIQLKFLAWI